MQAFLLNRMPLLRAFMLLALALLLTGSVFSQQGTPLTPDSEVPFIAKTNAAHIANTVAQNGSVSLIVGLDMSRVAGGSTFNTMSIDSQTRLIASAQASLAGTLGTNALNVQQYEFIPYMAVTVDAAGYQTLLSSPLVNYIQEDRTNRISLDFSTGQIGAPVAWGQGFNGSGYAVAILDTGVDKNHPFLSGSVVAEGCFGRTATFFDPFFGTIILNSPCPGADNSGDSTGNNTGLPCDATGCDHGTHVAGIAAGDGSTFDGVAPDASVIAVQVFTEVSNTAFCFPDPSPCVISFDSDILGGLNYVYSLRNTHNIAALNMSLGGGRYFDVASCNADNQPYRNIVSLLRNANIAVIASSGNNGFSNSMSSPACISGIISVGATTPSSTVASYSNAAPFLDLLAPGSSINSSVPGTGFDVLSGTSMAAPHVAGAWAIMRERSNDAPVDQVLRAFQKSGLPVTDNRNGRAFIQINVGEAIDFFLRPAPFALLTPTTASTVAGDRTPAFTWEHLPVLGSPQGQTNYPTEYRLVVYRAGSGAIAYNERFSAASACSGSTCSHEINVNLSDGRRYRWYVVAFTEYRKRNLANASLRFTIDYPGPATLISPANGTALAQPTDLPALSWSTVPGAVDYKLMVQNMNTGVRVLRVVTTSTSFDPAGDPDFLGKIRPGRDYRWWVVARSADGGKSRSERFTFSVSPSS